MPNNNSTPTQVQVLDREVLGNSRKAHKSSAALDAIRRQFYQQAAAKLDEKKSATASETAPKKESFKSYPYGAGEAAKSDEPPKASEEAAVLLVAGARGTYHDTFKEPSVINENAGAEDLHSESDAGEDELEVPAKTDTQGVADDDVSLEITAITESNAGESSKLDKTHLEVLEEIARSEVSSFSPSEGLYPPNIFKLGKAVEAQGKLNTRADVKRIERNRLRREAPIQYAVEIGSKGPSELAAWQVNTRVILGDYSARLLSKIKENLQKELENLGPARKLKVTRLNQLIQEQYWQEVKGVIRHLSGVLTQYRRSVRTQEKITKVFTEKKAKYAERHQGLIQLIFELLEEDNSVNLESDTYRLLEERKLSSSHSYGRLAQVIEEIIEAVKGEDIQSEEAVRVAIADHLQNEYLKTLYSRVTEQLDHIGFVDAFNESSRQSDVRRFERFAPIESNENEPSSGDFPELFQVLIDTLNWLVKEYRNKMPEFRETSLYHDIFQPLDGIYNTLKKLQSYEEKRKAKEAKAKGKDKALEPVDPVEKWLVQMIDILPVPYLSTASTLSVSTGSDVTAQSLTGALESPRPSTRGSELLFQKDVSGQEASYPTPPATPVNQPSREPSDDARLFDSLYENDSEDAETIKEGNRTPSEQGTIRQEETDPNEWVDQPLVDKSETDSQPLRTAHSSESLKRRASRRLSAETPRPTSKPRLERRSSLDSHSLLSSGSQLFATTAEANDREVAVCSKESLGKRKAGSGVQFSEDCTYIPLVKQGNEDQADDASILTASSSAYSSTQSDTTNSTDSTVASRNSAGSRVSRDTESTVTAPSLARLFQSGTTRTTDSTVTSRNSAGSRGSTDTESTVTASSSARSVQSDTTSSTDSTVTARDGARSRRRMRRPSVYNNPHSLKPVRDTEVQPEALAQDKQDTMTPNAMRMRIVETYRYGLWGRLKEKTSCEDGPPEALADYKHRLYELSAKTR